MLKAMLAGEPAGAERPDPWQREAIGEILARD
jgi:hypothetical protein